MTSLLEGVWGAQSSCELDDSQSYEEPSRVWCVEGLWHIAAPALCRVFTFIKVNWHCSELYRVYLSRFVFITFSLATDIFQQESIVCQYGAVELSPCSTGDPVPLFTSSVPAGHRPWSTGPVLWHPHFLLQPSRPKQSPAAGNELLSPAQLRHRDTSHPSSHRLLGLWLICVVPVAAACSPLEDLLHLLHPSGLCCPVGRDGMSNMWG